MEAVKFLMLPPGHGMQWNGKRFFHIPYWQFSSIPFPFHTKNLPFHTKIFFHIPFYTKIFFHILFHTSIPKKFLTGSNFNVYFAALHLCNVVSNRSWRCANNTKMQRLVSGMHIAHGLMHRCNLDFELGRGLNRKSCNDVIRSP